MSFLELQNVTKIYPNGTKAVNETSLNIDNGEFVVFVGPSGCGKSTLLRMIAGLEEITDGDISLDGKLINIVGRSFGGPKPYNPASSSSSSQQSSSPNNTFRHLENCADSMWLAKEKERKGSLSSSHYSLINNRELTGKIKDNFLYEGYGDLYKICLNEEEKDPSGFRKKYSK